MMQAHALAWLDMHGNLFAGGTIHGKAEESETDDISRAHHVPRDRRAGSAIAGAQQGDRHAGGGGHSPRTGGVSAEGV